MHNFPRSATSTAPAREVPINNATLVEAISDALFSAAMLAAKIAGGIFDTTAGLLAAPVSLAGRCTANFTVPDGAKQATALFHDATELELTHQLPEPNKQVAPIALAVRELEK